MSLLARLLAKIDELLLTERKETLYVIELIITGVLTDNRDFHSEIKEGKRLIRKRLEGRVEEEEFDFIYSLFERKLMYYKEHDTKTYRLKQMITDRILREQRTEDAKLLQSIYKSDGMEQKQETDVLKRLQPLLK